MCSETAEGETVLLKEGKIMKFFILPAFGSSGANCKRGTVYRVLCISLLAEQAVFFGFP